jgi:integrase
MLTDREIKLAKPNPLKNLLLADGDGLYLKVTKAGTKSFVHRFSYGSKRPEVTLGAYPTMTLLGAREALRKSKERLAAKQNPLVVKQEHALALRTAPTLDELMQLFHDEHLVNHHEQPAYSLGLLKRAFPTAIKRKLVPDLQPEDINDAISSIVKRGRKVTANRSLSIARQMFDWAVPQRYLAESPVKITRRHAGGQEVSREVNLMLDQLQQFLLVLRDFHGDANPTRDINPMTRLALLFETATAKRGLEVVTMEWRHVDRAAGVWDNPKELTKEKRGDHRVFLSSFALRVLDAAEELQRRIGASTYVFRRWSTPDKHMARGTLSQAVLRLHEGGQLKVKFTPHDLRRTFSSRLADLGVPPHVPEKCLDHLMTGMMAIYNRASYFPEREAAMKLWGETLDQLVTGE